jgi:poly-gamma-glutamate capsule biosynthesis protein CapA/YwtB (metallophosphatase superfamily)
MTPDFDWHTGTWESGRTLDRIRICIAGDWAPIRDFAPIMAQAPATVYGNLFDSINAADLKIFNLEAPFSRTGRFTVKSGASFRADPCHVAALNILSVDAVTLANNHIWDCGRAGFDHTLETLSCSRIRWTGAGRNLAMAAAPLILEKNNLKIGILNFSEGEDLTAATAQTPGVMGWEPGRVAARVKALRTRVDLVVVIAHCGIEYLPFPPPYVTEAFQRLAEAGADLVVGHHPHVPQGLQIHKNTPLFYSLGNFVFYQPTDLLFRKLGFILFAEIDSQGIAALEMRPYQIHEQGLTTLNRDQAADFFTAFRQVSRPLETPGGRSQAWQALTRYYGTRMMIPELTGILDKLDTDPPKGAAMLRNRITTRQHAELLKDTLTRMTAGRADATPSRGETRCHDLIHTWMTRTITR